MDSTLVHGVRRFNRTVTQRIGALDDAFLARDRPLGQARVLWEIGVNGEEVRALRSRLDLDSGYLSRQLRALESAGLVVVDADDVDGRVRTARLTEAGRAEVAELDRLSDGQAAAILEPLDVHQRKRLVDAMAEVERLLVASMVQVSVLDPREPDARSCRRAYFAELRERFEEGYDPGNSRSNDEADFTPPAGLMLVARLHGEPVGCGALRFHGEKATLKNMWVSREVRGLGLGRRLLAELEREAKRHGMDAVRLDTNKALTEAIAMYRATGYREVDAFSDEPYAHYWFEKALQGT